jgi:hypothetical protein
VKPDGLSAKLRWKSYSFCHVDSLLGTPFCPISGCQRKRVNSTSTPLGAPARGCDSGAVAGGGYVLLHVVLDVV